eukprot:1631122-Pyramimonas_sp.AAC.1
MRLAYLVPPLRPCSMDVVTSIGSDKAEIWFSVRGRAHWSISRSRTVGGNPARAAARTSLSQNIVP